MLNAIARKDLMSNVPGPGKVQMPSVKSWLLLKIQHFSFPDN